jgi:HAD superfamily hydrolase (TIGR01549 family)/HAD superfamily hydrolase (TIGR01509 family)
MTIQAVFFDMGGTIETFWYDRALRLDATHALRTLFLKAGIELGLDNENLYQLVSQGLEGYRRRALATNEELSPGRVWREFVLCDYPQQAKRLTAEAAEELMCFIEMHYYHRAMRPEVPHVLETIRAMGLKIGLISNVCSRGQVPTNLEEYGIRHYFSPVVLSSEYGRRKPDPAIFHYAASLANVPTGAVAYIGDRVARDIGGARRAGFRLAIQVRHDFVQEEDDTGPLPDRIIDNLDEFPPILAEEIARGRKWGVFRTVSGIRAVLFDAGDILYYRPNKEEKLKTFLAELGIRYLPPSIEDDEALKDLAFRNLISREEYHEALIRLYGVTRYKDVDCGKRLLEEIDHDIDFYPGAAETLHALKKHGFMLGIITDTATPVHVKLSWFERGGFGSVWDAIVSSKELGTRKPDPEIYQTALFQLGIGASQAVFVGHKSSELEGAQAIGMKTIAFNYVPPVTADYYISSLPEMLSVPLLSAAAVDPGRQV